MHGVPGRSNLCLASMRSTQQTSSELISTSQSPSPKLQFRGRSPDDPARFETGARRCVSTTSPTIGNRWRISRNADGACVFWRFMASRTWWGRHVFCVGVGVEPWKSPYICTYLALAYSPDPQMVRATLFIRYICGSYTSILAVGYNV